MDVSFWNALNWNVRGLNEVTEDFEEMILNFNSEQTFRIHLNLTQSRIEIAFDWIIQKEGFLWSRSLS